MPSGGARASAGRPADPNALRRDRKDDAGWLTLPSEAREGPFPDWPLTNQSVREAELWSRLWSKPIAAVWERDHATEQVAFYVRTFAEAEVADAPAQVRTLLQRLAGELLLTIPAMRQARISISPVKAAADDTTADTGRSSSSRSRLTVVKPSDGDVGA